jgi:hypothetical protein
MAPIIASQYDTIVTGRRIRPNRWTKKSPAQAPGFSMTQLA